MSNATTMSVVRPGSLRASKKSLSAEELASKTISKLSSPQIFGYLCYRHRAGLLTTALLLSNLLWVIHYHQ